MLFRFEILQVKLQFLAFVSIILYLTPLADCLPLLRQRFKKVQWQSEEGGKE